MKLLQFVLAANACAVARSFAPPILTPTATAQSHSKLHATTAQSDAERLLQKARALREAAKTSEDELHSTLIQKKSTRDAATDSIIAHIFPVGVDDGTCALCDRLRQKHLASDMLVQVVERLNEREVAARGVEHVEHHVDSTFKRVAEPNEAELNKIQGLVTRLIEAAEVLDKEFVEQKSECNGVITHSGTCCSFLFFPFLKFSKIIHTLLCFPFSLTDMMHWGGGNTAGILTDKANELGREHDEQFQKRQESYYEAAKRTHSREEFHEDSWRDSLPK